MLSPKQLRFVDEYLIDLNAAQAAIRAGYAKGGAAVQGARLLTNANVAAAIAERRREWQQRTEITQDAVLAQWWAIARADPAEISAVQRRCCRYCYGVGHAYQWTDETELAAALSVAEEFPNIEGGFGYDAKLSPHAKCPRCFGDGLTHVHLADTRTLSPGARLLYDGVKQTKQGIEVKMQDRARALENIAKHLGMFKEKLELTGKDGGPLQAITSEMTAKEAAELYAATIGNK